MGVAAQSVPGDGNSNNDNGSGLITSKKEIGEFSERLIEVTKHLPICLGSVFKIDSSFYGDWRIGITDDNACFLREASERYYRKDYAERRRNGEIERILKTEFKVAQERRMAEFIGIVVGQLLRSIDDGQRDFRILDMPSRDGKVSGAIADVLNRSRETEGILGRTTFHILDLSENKLDKTKGTLRQYGAKMKEHEGEDEVLLEQLPEGHFDIVVSLSHFHHKSFLIEYLGKIQRVLAENGALVVGDWHSPLCSHPALVQKLLFLDLCLSPDRQDLYRDNLRDQLLKDRKQLEDDEMEAAMDHMAHWNYVASRLPPNLRSKLSANLSEGISELDPRLYILGAYDTSRQREGKLESARFTTDMDKIRRAFPKAKLPEFSRNNRAVKTFKAGSDSAVVMAAVPRK